jgi:hypothetical protein
MMSSSSNETARKTDVEEIEIHLRRGRVEKFKVFGSIFLIRANESVFSFFQTTCSYAPLGNYCGRLLLPSGWTRWGVDATAPCLDVRLDNFSCMARSNDVASEYRILLLTLFREQ